MNNRFDGEAKFMVGLLVLFAVMVIVVQALGVPIYVSYSWFGYASSVFYGSDETVTFAHTVPAGDDRLLVVHVGIGFNEIVNSVVWGEPSGVPQALTLAESRAAAAGWKTEVWYLVNPAVRSDSIYVDIAGGHDGGVYGSFNFTDVNQDTPLGATADSSSGDVGVEPVVLLTTTYDNSFVLTVCTQHGANSGPYTPSAGQIEVYDTCSGVLNWDPNSWGGYIERATAGAQACSLDATGGDPDDDWAMVSIEIRTAPSDGSVLVSPAAAVAVGAAVDPTVVTTGPQLVEPAPAVAVAAAMDPIVGAPLSDYPSGAKIFYMSPPYSPTRTGFRAGNNSYSGSHPDTAWADIGYAEDVLVAGDTLFIMGGIYDNPQHEEFNHSGTASSPIVYKAYGDSIAVWTNPGNDLARRSKYFITSPGYAVANYVVIDGCSYLNENDSLYLKLTVPTVNAEGVQYMVTFSDDDGWTFRGVEFDLQNLESLCRGTPGGYGCYPNAMFYISDCEKFLVERNYMHHPGGPTSCWHDGVVWGDSTDQQQGSTEAIMMWDSYGGVVRWNTFKYINHGAVYMNRCDYISYIQNFIEQHRGGGIYIGVNSEYCLLDGNIITHCGQSVTYRYLPDEGDCAAKGKGMQLSGSHNTLRRNAFFTPWNGNISMSGNHFGNPVYEGNDIRYNNIYNNTVYKGVHHGLGSTRTLSQTWNPERRVWHNRIFNNIFYNPELPTYEYEGPLVNIMSMIRHYTAETPADLNWCDPDDGETTPQSTHWGDNYHHNNLMSRDSTEASSRNSADWDSMIFYYDGSDDYGVSTRYYRFYSINEAEAEDPTAWGGNITGLPNLVTADPDAYGLRNEWWRVSLSSPVVNAGRRMTDSFVDTNGTWAGLVMDPPPQYMQDAYSITTYGWSDTLAWYGSAPDIGAYETMDGDAVIPAAATAVATAVDPAVEIAGAEAIEPAVATVAATAVEPTVVLGSTSVAPAAASAVATAINPSIAGKILATWATFNANKYGFGFKRKLF